MLAEAWRDRLVAAGVEAPLAARLGIFLELLQRWGQVLDLTGRLDAGELVRDHVVESLAGAGWLQPGVMVDAGSGSGFPGIPLLLARPEVRGILVEPRQRRWAFLKEAVRELGLDAEVFRGRVEALDCAGAANLTVRALAREAWEAEARRLVASGGRVLWWAGPRADVAPPEGFASVVTCPLPNPKRGRLVVWGRCST